MTASSATFDRHPLFGTYNTDSEVTQPLPRTPMLSPVECDALTDKQLIAHIRETDSETAWETLVRRHSSKAYHIAYGVLGNRDDAEEVAQDAFVRIYRALDRFRGDSEFSTWMYRIVVNQARNKYRWNKRRGANLHVSIHKEIDRPDSNLTLDLPDGKSSPDKAAIFNEWDGEIKQALEQLPEVNREALVLRIVHNMAYEQIAEILQCKVGTVKSRIARAREELRRRLRV
jgi:RNA polymerase sigma-70 factor (ECF subfamily)